MADETPIIDEESFTLFSEVMGDGTSRTIVRYSQAARGYLDALALSIPAGDAIASAQAAHPLKSSSQQVGALRVAALAEEIEAHAAQDTPDFSYLGELRKKAVLALDETDRSFAERLAQGVLK